MPPEEDDGGGPAAVDAASGAAHSSAQDDQSLEKALMQGGKAVAAELARKAVPAWCREVSLLLAKFQAQNREQIRMLALPTCVLCTTRVQADLRCLQPKCGAYNKPLCSQCSDRCHASENARAHRQSVTSNCPHCHLERVSLWCPDCDLTFCEPCFSTIHSVKRAKSHRRICLEGADDFSFRCGLIENDAYPSSSFVGAPGTLLAKASWSRAFQSMILQIMTHGSTGYHQQQASRKRPLEQNEVITIDSDDDGANDQQASDAMNQPTSRPFIRSINLHDTNQLVRYGSAPQNPTPLACHQNGDAVMPPAIPEPIPFPSHLQQQQSQEASYGENSFINPMAPLPNAPMPSGPPVISGYTSQAAPAMVTPSSSIPMQPANGQSTSSGWATAPTTVTHQSQGHGLQMPMSQSSTQTNPLEDALYDRYTTTVGQVVQMEQHIIVCNSRIMQLSYQDMERARRANMELQKEQQQLLELMALRDQMLVEIVVQSRTIIQQVKMLRLDVLNDIPLVVNACHQKCLQFSQQIAQTRQEAAAKHLQMANTVQSMSSLRADMFHSLVSQINNEIQFHERRVGELKEQREKEIVCMVQYSQRIRQQLKAMVQKRALDAPPRTAHSMR